MPFRLKISNEEVKSELTKMGYTNLNEEIIEEFRRDLLKLIKDDLKSIKKLKKSQECEASDSSKGQKYKKYEYLEPSTSTPTSYLENEKEKYLSPSSSGYSETFTDSSDTCEGYPKRNERLKRQDTEYSTSVSSECSAEVLSSGDTEEEVQEISKPVKKADQIRPLSKFKGNKEKGLPAYPDRPDAVNLYHFYKAHWDKYKVPGEDPRSALRWDIRSKLFYSS